MKLSEYIKKNYKEKGKTQADAAEANGISPQHLGQMIKDDRYEVISGRLMIVRREFK